MRCCFWRVCPSSCHRPSEADNCRGRGGSVWNRSVECFCVPGVASAPCSAALCRRCDRGQIYCGQSCSSAARVEAQRAAGERYQSGDAGRIHHVERTRRWRLRQKDRCAPGETDTDPVTHQGSPLAPTAAPVLPSSLLPNVERLPAVDVAQTPWICAGCVTAMPAWVRMGSSIEVAPGHACVMPGRALRQLRHRSTLLPPILQNRSLASV